MLLATARFFRKICSLMELVCRPFNSDMICTCNAPKFIFLVTCIHDGTLLMVKFLLIQLIHCASCCEPYHRFCLEDGLRDTSFLADSNHGNSEEWRYNWVCQRCTVCHSCGRGLGQQLSCQRCHRTYHTECLGADRLSGRLHSPDRPWVRKTLKNYI